LVVGLILLTSAGSAIGFARFGDNYFFIKRQLLYGVLPGLVAFFTLSKIEYTYFRKVMWVIFGLMVLSLLLVFIPGLGANFSKGAKSWLQVGSISLQPSEFAKLGLILFMSAFLEKQGRKIENFTHGFLVSLGIGMVPIVLIVLQPDVGTVFIIFSILFGLLYVGGAKISHMVALAAAGVGGFITMILIAPYRAARLTTFLHPELDPLGIGYHMNQALLAVGSGGLFGLGLGQSRQKFQYLPEVHADSIFAIFAEEMGFIFAVAFLVLLCVICFRGLMIAKHAKDDYGKLVVAGIVIWFMVQSLLNIGAMVNLLPLTGVPLPFVSHGGTALMMGMGALGIIMNISKYTHK